MLKDDYGLRALIERLKFGTRWKKKRNKLFEKLSSPRWENLMRRHNKAYLKAKKRLRAKQAAMRKQIRE